MKKYISILSLLLAVLMLTSCGVYKDPITTDDVSAVGSSEVKSTEIPSGNPEDSDEYGDSAKDRMDGEWFYYLGKDEESGLNTVWRYNLSTNVLEPACQDPACNHRKGSGCPFEMAAYNQKNTVGLVEGLRAQNALYQSFTVSDGVVYYFIGSLNKNGVYDRTDINSPYYLCSYDTKTLEFKRICQYETYNDYSLYVSDGYLYFFQPHYLEYVNESQDAICEVYLVRCNIETGQKEELFYLQDVGLMSSRQYATRLCTIQDGYGYFIDYAISKDASKGCQMKFLKYPLEPGATPVITTKEHPITIKEAYYFKYIGVADDVLYYTKDGSLYRHDLQNDQVAISADDVYSADNVSTSSIRVYGKYLYYFSTDCNTVYKLNCATEEKVSYPYDPTEGSYKAPWGSMAFAAGKLINYVVYEDEDGTKTIIYDLKTGECVYPEEKLIF